MIPQLNEPFLHGHGLKRPADEGSPLAKVEVAAIEGWELKKPQRFGFPAPATLRINPHEYYFIWNSASEVVGLLGFHLAPTQLYFNSVWVDPTKRKRGVGFVASAMLIDAHFANHIPMVAAKDISDAGTALLKKLGIMGTITREEWYAQRQRIAAACHSYAA